MSLMDHFDGLLRLAGDYAPPIRVMIDLTENHELKISSENVPIGEWRLGQVAIHAQDDGFHMISDGEELVITTDNDPAFAVLVGIRNAPAQLRKRMSMLMRNDPRFHHVEDPSVTPADQ